MASFLRHLNPYQLDLRSLSGPQYVTISDRSTGEQLDDALKIRSTLTPRNRLSRGSKRNELLIRKVDHRHN
jgi:hypothetical protein